ncbi:MAG: response regulator [Gallionella sp.]|nr:response regulator [Gallionella sp.]
MQKSMKPSVVVVDDDSMMREMLKLILLSEDYPVVGEAANGQAAIALCAREKPGLVLLDINMPKMDGMQALEEIHKASPATVVLMVSAEATLDKVREAMEKGAAGFVVKPLNPASVLDRVAKCFNGKK